MESRSAARPPRPTRSVERQPEGTTIQVGLDGETFTFTA